MSCKVMLFSCSWCVILAINLAKESMCVNEEEMGLLYVHVCPCIMSMMWLFAVTQ